jgi:hypothetical protein
MISSNSWHRVVEMEINSQTVAKDKQTSRGAGRRLSHELLALGGDAHTMSDISGDKQTSRGTGRRLSHDAAWLG